METENKAATVVMKEGNPHIVVITGAESTGKTALAKFLGGFFSSPWYPEYAREYLEKKGSNYTFSDVETIARVQLAQMEEARLLKNRFVFFDTWLIITKVWMEVVYGKSPGWIQQAIATAPVDLYLLCRTDIPWIPDLLRENGGEMREKLSSEYERNIIRYDFPFKVITGQGNIRFSNATEIIRDFFSVSGKEITGIKIKD